MQIVFSLSFLLRAWEGPAAVHSPAVVDEVLGKDRNVNMLPVHGVQQGRRSVDTSR